MKKALRFLLNLPLNISILVVSFLGTVFTIAPFVVINYYSVTFKPCGDTWAALWCTMPLFVLASFATLITWSLGVAALYLLLKAKKAKNITLMLLASGFFSTMFFFCFPNALNFHFLYLVPLLILTHYHLFNLIKKPTFGLRPSIASLVAWFLLFHCLFFIKTLTEETKRSQPVRNKIRRTAPTGTEQVERQWKTYEDENVSFRYPAEWTAKPLFSHGSGSSLIISDPQITYTLTFSILKNINSETSQPYGDIDEFIQMPYRVKEVLVDGREGRQPLPRAGSENINSVSFFADDERTIYTLTLQSGRRTQPASEEQIRQGQKIFEEILTSFKFNLL